ncbi:MAG: endolytic transglycosylase MltG [Candidatus Peribacteraceae bacterium]|nr:endolytic transglycosylase MltG [Candidatus Peribacteraceae bacterium]
MKKFFLIVGVVLLAAFFWYRHGLWSAGSAQNRTVVTVESGMSVSAIADLLAEKDIIRSPSVFRLYVRLHGMQTKLQAGRFVLSGDMSVPEMVEVLRSGKSQEISVTIPEGWTVKDIDAAIARLGLAASGSILDCAQRCDFSSFDFLPEVSGLAERGGKLEGYLYPDTYFADTANFVPKFFLERMLGAFRKNVVTGQAEAIKASGYSLHEIVTMASLVEEETKTDEERPVVAGILWKRYDGNIGLGVDATVRYILDKPKSAITLSDLDTVSPYNTRKFRGLPPGPIANAGLKSIRAALDPQESPYWYYLHDAKGLIHYATTNEEHNENRRQYLR